MRYGFSKDGSFVVADDQNRIGEFAFPSSPRAEQAKRDPARTAHEMLAAHWKQCPQHIREQHYLLSVAALPTA